MFLVFLTLSGILIGTFFAAFMNYETSSALSSNYVLPIEGARKKYFLILVSGLVFSWIIGFYPPSGRAIVEGGVSLLGLLAYFSYIYFLVALTTFVALWNFVPNRISKPSIIIGLLSALFVPGLAGSFHFTFLPANVDSLLYNTTGAIIGYGFYWGIRYVYLRFRNIEGITEGCIKLGAMLGAYLGPTKMLVVIFFSALIGSIVGLSIIGLTSVWVPIRDRMRTELSYSGIMALTGIIVCFIGDFIIKIYVNLYNR